MGKKIVITAGPTNERIDSVMQITNMSTGALGTVMAEAFADYAEAHPGAIDAIYYLSPKLAVKPKPHAGLVTYVNVTNADSLLKALTCVLTEEDVDAVVHNAAVGDYKAKYSVRGEDLAEEIAKVILNMPYGTGGLTRENVYDAVLRVLDDPKCAADDSGKMSSYEPHLMTMMALTPKVIGQIKKLAPHALLIGSKLLDGVSQQELFDVASRLRKKNGADYVIANDLSRIGHGAHPAMIVGYDNFQERDVVVAECGNKDEIARAVVRLVLGEDLPVAEARTEKG